MAGWTKLPPVCAADCGVPMDPFLATQGWTMHPACEFPERTGREHERGGRRARKTPTPTHANQLTIGQPLPPAPDPEPPAPREPGYGTKARDVYDTIDRAGRNGVTDRELRATVTIDQSAGGVGAMVGYMLVAGSVVRAPGRRDGQDVYVGWQHVPTEHRRT